MGKLLKHECLDNSILERTVFSSDIELFSSFGSYNENNRTVQRENTFSDLNFKLVSILRENDKKLSAILNIKVFEKCYCPQTIIFKNLNPTNGFRALAQNIDSVGVAAVGEATILNTWVDRTYFQ